MREKAFSITLNSKSIKIVFAIDLSFPKGFQSKVEEGLGLKLTVQEGSSGRYNGLKLDDHVT